MAIEIESVAQKYEDLPLTNFPVAEDSFDRMQDVSSDLLPYVIQYESLRQSGDFDTAAQLIADNPELLNCIWNADKQNHLYDAITALQRYELNQVANLYTKVSQSAIGINDVPTEEETSVVAYSAEKVNRLHNKRNISVPASGWSSTFPYTNTVTVEGITSKDDLKVIGIYIPDNATVAQIKAWNKVLGMLISNENAISDETITFKAYKKPTVDITVITEGG